MLRSISGSLSNIRLLQFISQLHPGVVVVVETVVVVGGADVVVGTVGVVHPGPVQTILQATLRSTSGSELKNLV